MPMHMSAWACAPLSVPLRDGVPARQHASWASAFFLLHSRLGSKLVCVSVCWLHRPALVARMAEWLYETIDGICKGRADAPRMHNIVTWLNAEGPGGKAVHDAFGEAPSESVPCLLRVMGVDGDQAYVSAHVSQFAN